MRSRDARNLGGVGSRVALDYGRQRQPCDDLDTRSNESLTVLYLAELMDKKNLFHLVFACNGTK
jgi:hypothetical protein